MNRLAHSKRILTVIGARPQFVKAAAVSRAIANFSGLEEVVVHTGQHFDRNMSAVFFDELGISTPAYNLGIGGGRHGEMTGRQLEAIEGVLLAEQPELVLVYGDTNSTLAGALAAAKLNIPVAHVEAGLRSYNRQMPEEINRVMTDHLSSLLMAPTVQAQRNLAKEGVPSERISMTGDVMFDAALHYAARARMPDWFGQSNLEPGGFVLCTLHRAENTDEVMRLTAILSGLARCRLRVVLPLHPRTRSRIEDFGLTIPDSILAVAPVGYLEMVWLEKNCSLVVTDSGGVQKEAYFHKKRCVTLREETEWVELVEAGVNQLVGADADAIAEAIESSNKIATFDPLYGEGKAAYRVATLLEAYLR